MFIRFLKNSHRDQGAGTRGKSTLCTLVPNFFVESKNALEKFLWQSPHERSISRGHEAQYGANVALIVPLAKGLVKQNGY